MAVLPRASPVGEWISSQTVLFHEYTHHFMCQYYAGAYPLWYREGFAEYLSTATFKGGASEVGRASPSRVIALLGQSWMPIERLFNPDAKDRIDASFYPEAWLVTHYLFDDSEPRGKLLA